tara:strand:- start:18720 stop:19730 length:1011 start_codon:yes stop_codon:yes gene_type:complete
MAQVKLTDVYRPSGFARRAQEKQYELNNFVSSGVVTQDPVLAQKLSGGSETVSLPQFNGITIEEPNYSTDNPASSSTPKKISSGLQVARAAARNQSWSAMSLARELTDADPMGAIVGRVGNYWASDDETRLIASFLGILADNKASDSGDMVVTLGTDVDAAVVDAERISADAILTAAQTMGDHKTSLVAVAMHSVTETRLARQGLLKTFSDPTTGKALFNTYLGYRVLVDDSMPAVSGTNRIMYTVALFGVSAVSYATGNVSVPSEIDRTPASGDGGGEDILFSRVNTCFHPNGFKWLEGSVAGQAPTYAELKLAANWNRQVARKSVSVAFLEVND